VNASLPEDRRFVFRMGINLGEVIVDGATIHGDGVNVAARLQKLAEPGGLVISRAVHEQVRGRVAAEFEDLGEQRLHNIVEPVRAYRVRAAEPVPAASRGEDARRRQSIAVLPFTNMSGDPEQEYFSDGITEDLITALARHHGLFVIARNSSFVFKGKATPIPEVGRRLGVRYVVEGSVRKVGKRLRITAQLIDAETGAHVWAERYDRDLEDVFALQDEIVETLVWRVAGHVTKAELAALRRKRTPDLDAYELYLEGVSVLHVWDEASARKALALFERALAIDPRFSQALTGSAYAHGLLAAILESEDHRAQGIALARKAVELDDGDVEAYAFLARTSAFLGRDDESDAFMSKAQTLNPNSPLVVNTKALILLWRGRVEESLALAERASRLNPITTAWEAELVGTAKFFLGRHEEALRSFAQIPPTAYYWQHYIRAAALAEVGRLDEARASLAEAIRLRPTLSATDSAAFKPFRPHHVARWVDALRKVGLPE
jgi:adenylate cyclase